MRRRAMLPLFFLLLGAGLASAQVAVIANKTAPDDTLSQSRLFDFYSGDIKFWSAKVPVVVFDLKPASEIKEAFYKLLGKTPSRMKSIWLKKLLMGEGEPPVALSSEEEMVKRVAATPGAIGFVSQPRVNASVKIVMISAKSEK